MSRNDSNNPRNRNRRSSSRNSRRNRYSQRNRGRTSRRYSNRRYPTRKRLGVASRSSSRNSSSFNLSTGEGFFETASSQQRSSRDSWILVILLVIAFVIFIRLFFLQVVFADEYSSRAESIRTSEETIYAKRGTIYDRNGNVLATSVDAVTIYANPQEITDPYATAEAIASVTGEDSSTYIEALTKETTFAYIVRQADLSVGEALQAKYSELQEEIDTTYASLEEEDRPQNPLQGIYYLDDVKRVYPYGEVAGQIIGYVGVDGEGLSGLELYYDDILSGTDGYKVVEYGLGGIPIPGGVKVYEAAQDGKDIMISIDITLQQYAEETLVDYAEQSNTSSADITIIDGETGEIYATASLPLYDLNNINDAEEDASVLKTVTSYYEPGSIFKTVTASLLLEKDLVSLDEVIEVPESRTISGWTFSDSTEHDTLYMTISEILAQSSNIGISLLEERMSSEEFYSGLIDFGFGSKTGVDYPGESGGVLSSYESWSGVQEANISFGQGVAVTSVQMASFYGMIAADGVYVQPHFLIGYPSTGEVVEYESTQMLSESTCQTLTELLCLVVEEGTGAAAAIDGYSVAGKTGTAQKANDDGTYSEGVYIIDFAGYLANTNSSLTCVVAFDNPGMSAAMPVFSKVMSYAADLYIIVNE